MKIIERINELCQKIGIQTLGDLKRFKDDYNLINPTGEQLIAALEKELELGGAI